MKKTAKKSGFTLIELLVVITIIGILAGLAVPAISGALERAKQTADVANVRQLGVVFFTLANDENGVFPVAPYGNATVRPTTPSANTVALFGGMMEDGDLTEAKIIATNGTVPYKGSKSSAASNMVANNVGFDYLAGLTTTDDSSIPLFVSKNAVSSPSSLQGSSGSTIDLNLASGHVWKDKGIVVYYVGNSAEFIKARKGLVPTPIQDSGVIDTSVVTLMQDK